MRQVWSGAVPPAAGFLRPEPLPPIVVAAFGPKMAKLAGRVGDGICVPAGPKLADLVFAEAILPAILDGGKQRLPYFLSLAACRRVASQPAEDTREKPDCRRRE